MDNDYTIISIQRALKILKLFDSSNARLTLMEISQLSGLNKSTTLRILYTLKNEDFVKYDERTREYSLGNSIFKLGNYMYNTMNLNQISKPFIREISNRMGVVVHLGIYESNSIVIVDKVYPNKELTWPRMTSVIGGIIPVYCTGIGRLFLAHMDTQKVMECLDNVKIIKYTATTIIDKNQILSEVEKAKEMNVSFCNCEHEPYIYSVSAPIYDRTNSMIAGVSIGGFKDMFKNYRSDELSSITKKLGKSISEGMGYSGQYR